MTSLFIDESKSNGYRLAVVVVDDSDVTRIRAGVASLRLANQQRIHFTKESDQRRRHILKEMQKLDIRSFVFLVEGRREAYARAWGLEQVAELCTTEPVQRIVLETDDSLVRSDRRTLYEQLDKRGLRGTVSYGHQRASSEPLLWAPDAVAWSDAKGGEWRRLARPLIAAVRTHGR